MDTKLYAIALAHKIASGRPEGYAYAIQTPRGWYVEHNKPMTRAGQVIECRDDGREYPA